MFICILHLPHHVSAIIPQFLFPVSVSQIQLEDSESPDSGLPLDGRCHPEPKFRTVRKPEHSDDYLQSYKFKNSIERRFSRSQDSEITEVLSSRIPCERVIPGKYLPTTTTHISVAKQ